MDKKFTCSKCGWINLPSSTQNKVDTLAALLEYFTEDQLLQLAEKCNRAQYASQGNGRAEVFVRFTNGRPRFFGVQTWEEAQK